MTANDDKLEIAVQAEDLDFNPFPPPPSTVVRPSLKGTGPCSLNRDDAAVAERDNRRVLKGGK